MGLSRYRTGCISTDVSTYPARNSPTTALLSDEGWRLLLLARANFDPLRRRRRRRRCRSAGVCHRQRWRTFDGGMTFRKCTHSHTNASAHREKKDQKPNRYTRRRPLRRPYALARLRGATWCRTHAKRDRRVQTSCRNIFFPPKSSRRF